MFDSNASNELQTEKQNLRDHAWAFNLFGRIWLREIDVSFLLQLQQCQVELEACGIATLDLQAEKLDRLAVDYCQLLVGPRGAISPLQSVAATGLMGGECVSSMREMLSYQQRTIEESVTVDHLGFQLQMMGSILHSLTLATDENLQPLQHYTATFFAQHVSWGSAWSRRVAMQAETAFYRSAALATQKLIDLAI